MRRCAFLIVVIAVLLWAGCGSSDKPSAMSFSPSSLSVVAGESQQLTPIASDSKGNIVSTNFAVDYASSDTSIADVNTSGYVCAGHWDNDTAATPGACHPTTCTQPCVATITGVIQGEKITGQLTVMVHPRVAAVVISPPATNCISSGGSSYAVTACAAPGTATGSQGACASGYVDITSQVWMAATSTTPAVSPFGWVVTPSTAASVDTSGATCTQGYVCKITATTSNPNVIVNATFQSAPGGSTSNNVSASLSTATCQ